MCDVSTQGVTLAVTTDIPLADEQARDVAARWAANGGLVLGMTSTVRDEPWLRVTAGVRPGDAADPAQVIGTAIRNLEAELRNVGARVAEWHAVELLSATEVERRLQRPTIPPMVNAEQFGELAGLSRQRIGQYESDRAAGKRDDFPAPVLDGYWLRSMAEHWARTRKTKPGPAPRRPVAGA